ncbi:MAG: STAS domain-containing protein [Proteobacteria bacterium]|nr:STAS domain-containing protein [Pseudomonadota bacterium]
MTSAVLTDQFDLKGVIDFSNMVAIRAQGETHIAARDALISVNLKGLEESNSVTVALLIAWMRCANNQGISIVYINVPQELRDIIEFSGLTTVLPIDNA